MDKARAIGTTRRTGVRVRINRNADIAIVIICKDNKIRPSFLMKLLGFLKTFSAADSEIPESMRLPKRALRATACKFYYLRHYLALRRRRKAKTQVTDPLGVA